MRTRILLKLRVRQKALPVSPACSVRSTSVQSVVPNGISNISMGLFLAGFPLARNSAPLRQGRGQAFRPAIEHGAPARHARAVDIGRRVVYEQDRLCRSDAHA